MSTEEYANISPHAAVFEWQSVSRHVAGNQNINLKSGVWGSTLYGGMPLYYAALYEAASLDCYLQLATCQA